MSAGAGDFEQWGCEIRSFVLPLHMCRLSIKKIDGDRQKEWKREALKADAPKGSVLQRICCTKNADEKVFTEEGRKLCINMRGDELIHTCCVCCLRLKKQNKQTKETALILCLLFSASRTDRKQESKSTWVSSSFREKLLYWLFVVVLIGYLKIICFVDNVPRI